MWELWGMGLRRTIRAINEACTKVGRFDYSEAESVFVSKESEEVKATRSHLRSLVYALITIGAYSPGGGTPVCGLFTIYNPVLDSVANASNISNDWEWYFVVRLHEAMQRTGIDSGEAYRQMPYAGRGRRGAGGS